MFQADILKVFRNFHIKPTCRRHYAKLKINTYRGNINDKSNEVFSICFAILKDDILRNPTRNFVLVVTLSNRVSIET